MNRDDVERYTKEFIKLIKCNPLKNIPDENDIKIFLDLISKSPEDKQRASYIVSKFMEQIKKSKNLDNEGIIRIISGGIIRQMNPKTKVENIKPLRGLIKQFRGTGEDCGHITDYGKRCKNATIYHNTETKKSKDCTDYCGKYISNNCYKFMEDMITNLLFGDIKINPDEKLDPTQVRLYLKKPQKIYDSGLFKRSYIFLEGFYEGGIENTISFKVEFSPEEKNIISKMTLFIEEIYFELNKDTFEDNQNYKSKCLSFIKEQVIPNFCKCNQIDMNFQLQNSYRLNRYEKIFKNIKFQFGEIKNFRYGQKKIIKLEKKEKITEMIYPPMKECKHSLIKDVLHKLISEILETTDGEELKENMRSLTFRNIGKSCDLDLIYDENGELERFEFSTDFYDRENVTVIIDDVDPINPESIDEKILDVIYKNMCFVGGIMYIDIVMHGNEETKNVKVKFTDKLTLKSKKERHILKFKLPLEDIDEEKIIKWREKREKLNEKISLERLEKERIDKKKSQKITDILKE